MKGLDDELELDLVELEEDEDVIPQLVDDDSDIIDEDDIIFSHEEIKNDLVTNPLVTELLKAKGIKDSKIKIINEDNTESEIDFYKLTTQEQLDILTSDSPKEEIDLGLDETEAEFLNYLRENNLSIDKYLELHKASVEAELEKRYEKSYDIDAYGDEELFLLDLKAKYDLTDDELEKELEKALEDKDLFSKKVTKLRQEYKELEDAYEAEEQKKFAQKQEEDFNNFAKAMVKVAVETPELHGIELEDSEKNEVLSYLLELDEQGSSKFYTELKDPTKLYEAAWFLRYGKEAFETIIDAYEQEIKKLKEDSSTPSIKVIKKEPKKVKSIYDLN